MNQRFQSRISHHLYKEVINPMKWTKVKQVPKTHKNQKINLKQKRAKALVNQVKEVAILMKRKNHILKVNLTDLKDDSDKI